MKQKKQRVHYAAAYLLNPTNPIEIVLIGAGGTGSQVLMCLARMNHALIELGHPGFNVRLMDDDTISKSNLGRQLFAKSEVGMYKSEALISRVNRFFGTSWRALTSKFQGQSISADIYISCLDNVAGRISISESLKQRRNYGHNRITNSYWMDFGNSKRSGQVLLSTLGDLKQPKSNKFQPIVNMPFITEEFGEAMIQTEKEDDTPSCSLAEALEKQDLFINSTLAQMGSSLLWNLFRDGMILNRGFFLNLENFKSAAIPV